MSPLRIESGSYRIEDGSPILPHNYKWGIVDGKGISDSWILNAVNGVDGGTVTVTNEKVEIKPILPEIRSDGRVLDIKPGEIVELIKPINELAEFRMFIFGLPARREQRD